jgi:hypothetical protein
MDNLHLPAKIRPTSETIKRQRSTAKEFDMLASATLKPHLMNEDPWVRHAVAPPITEVLTDTKPVSFYASG